MSNETIEVFYVNLNADVSGKGVYHGTLVYTNSEGVKYFAGAGPSNTSMTKEERASPLNAFLAEVNKNGPLGTPYGKLVGYVGEVNSPVHSAVVAEWLTKASGHDLLKVGPSLQAEFSKIVQVFADLNVKNLDYAPLTQNSNGVWCTAAVASGTMNATDIPANAYVGSTYWTPGCTVLPMLAYGPSFVTSIQTSDVDGDPIVQITNADPYGNVVSTINLAGTHQDVIHEINDGIIQHDAMGYGLTIFGDNNYIRLASGDAQIYGNGSLVYMGNNTDVSIIGNVNDIVTSNGGSVAFEGDGNWLKLVSNIDMDGNGNYNDIGVKTDSNIVTINGSNWDIPRTSRADDIWGNSVSGADVVLSTPNSDWWKYPDSPIHTVNRGSGNDLETVNRPMTPRELALSQGIIPFANSVLPLLRDEPGPQSEQLDEAVQPVILVGWPQTETNILSW